MPKHIQGRVQITRDCNQECVFCSVPLKDDQQNLEQVKKKIRELKSNGTTEIMLTGGEPLKSKVLLDSIAYSAKMKFEEISIQTNSSMLDESLLKKILSINPVKLVVSVHTLDKETYGKISGKPENFVKVMASLDLIRKYKVPAYLATVICSLNYRELPSIIKGVTTKYPNINHFSLNYVDPTMKAAENTWIVPKYCDTERHIHEAVFYMLNNKISFRLERVPLCYMDGFEEFSTDIRRGVFDEERMTSFFVTKNDVYVNDFVKEKNSRYRHSKQCGICYLRKLCPGINPSYVNVHGDHEVYPVFSDPNIIIGRIRTSRL